MNKAKNLKWVFGFILIVALSCESHNEQALQDFSSNQLVQWNRNLTAVIIADIFTPPQASRIYAYTNVAAYEVMSQASPEAYPSLARTLHELTIIEPVPGEHVFLPLASIIAFSTVAQQLVYNGPKIVALEEAYLKEIQKIGIDREVRKASLAFGRAMGNHILTWADQDGYNQRTALSRYTVTNQPGLWKPTPPDYMDAIEPHWNTLRPFLLDSVSQFDPGSPTAFDTVPGSPFYEGTLEVYETVKDLDDERLAIAKFWDCNPNISYTQGHVMYYQQQISPGGHWIHIAAQALEAENGGMLRATEVMSKVSVTIADAFISCWNEKYRSNLIRPETYINQYIDPQWKPILQTPAFPEHTSGHSVASGSAAVMLTDLFGENYAFSDSTEVPYGLPTRHFDSFIAASEEAAISRLYGGIHYMPAIEDGIRQGKLIGAFTVSKLNEQ